MDASDLKSRAGQLLYRELPEEYRYQDPPPTPGELGDLEAYLHAFGHLLDLIRGTTEQAYADAFAEPADNGREIQTWLIPYLAELVGAELRAPAPAARRAELNNAVDWYKAKGSVETVNEIADVVSGEESVVVEGWRRTLVTPRLALPPFSAPASAMGSGDPSEAPGLPQGTPDIRFFNRAVIDDAGSNPLYRLARFVRDEFGRRRPAEAVFWTPLDRGAAPCFPRAYDDTSVRTPDVRDPKLGDVGPHPSRAIIHVRPPEGLFETGLNGDLAPTTANIGIDPNDPTRQLFRPIEVLGAMGLLDDAVIDAMRIDGEVALPDRLVVAGDLAIPDGAVVEIEDLLIDGTVTVSSPDTRLTLRRSAVRTLVVSAPTPMEAEGDPAPEPPVKARDSLFGEITGGVGFAELIYCTVLGDVALERLHASDSLFAGRLIDLDCSGDRSCVRFSRVDDLGDLAGCGAEKSPSNTDDDPNFLRLWFDDGGDCVLRAAAFGEPGAGVLDLASSEAIRAGAEDEGEMGVGHHLFQAAQIRALALKLTDYLPLGQEVAIRYDPHLSRPPARADGG